MSEKKRGEIKGPYNQKTIRERIEAFLLDNVGKIVTREQIIQVATDPRTGREPENWHQRLSELRTDVGYTILSQRDKVGLKLGEYMLESYDKRPTAKKRIVIDRETWETVLKRAKYQCQWEEGGRPCGLKDGDTDPIGGGTVRLTPDHKTPHATGNAIDPKNPDEWRVLCGRHQVMKKNYWDTKTGKLNVYAIVQSAPKKEKAKVFKFLKKYFEKSEG